MLWTISLKRLVLWVTAAAGCCVIVGAQDATIPCSNVTDGDEFFFFKTVSNFSEALEFCFTFGPDITLARVGNAATAEVLKGASKFEPDFWVGIFDKDQIGGKDITTRFSFVDGTTEDLPFIQGAPGNDPWDRGQPNDGGDAIEACVLFKENSAKIEDKPCSEKHPFACRRICPSGVGITNSPILSLTLSPTTAPQNNAGFFVDSILSQALFGAGFLVIFAAIVAALVLLIQERRAVAELKLILADDITEASQKNEAPEKQEVSSERVVEIDISALESPRSSIQSKPERLSSADL